VCIWERGPGSSNPDIWWYLDWTSVGQTKIGMQSMAVFLPSARNQGLFQGALVNSAARTGMGSRTKCFLKWERYGFSDQMLSQILIVARGGKGG